MRRSFVIPGLIASALGAPVPAEAHSPEDWVRAAEIAGTVCTTKGGATFTFLKDGHYAYDGMWTDTGHYSVRKGSVTILLDSGLERDFAVSRRDGVLYIEQTAVRCTQPNAGALTHGRSAAPQ